MNNRTTLILLIGLTALAGGARLYSGYRHQKHEDAFAKQRGDYKYIWETTEELRDRRSKYALADDEQGYLEHFQTRAYGAEMGTVNPVPNTRTRNTYTDKIFTLEFLESENPRFVRGQIVNMIYNSENLLPRMRCTTLKVTPAPAGTTRSRRGVPPGEDRDDVWKVDTMVFTQRTPTARERS